MLALFQLSLYQPQSPSMSHVSILRLVSRGTTQLKHITHDLNLSLLRQQSLRGLTTKASPLAPIITIQKTVPSTHPDASPEDKLKMLQEELVASLKNNNIVTFTTEMPAGNPLHKSDPDDADLDTITSLDSPSSPSTTRTPVEISTEIMSISKKTFPSAHPALARSYNDHAYVLKTSENFETSIEYYIKSLQTYEESIGKLSPSYSAVLRNLSAVYRDAALGLELPSEASGETKKDFNAERDALIQRSREAADDALHWSERWLKKVNKEIEENEDTLYGPEEYTKGTKE